MLHAHLSRPDAGCHGAEMGNAHAAAVSECSSTTPAAPLTGRLSSWRPMDSAPLAQLRRLVEQVGVKAAAALLDYSPRTLGNAAAGARLVRANREILGQRLAALANAR